MCKEEKYINIQTGEELDWDKVRDLKDNALLKNSPHLFMEWDFEKNNELGLNIYKVTKSSARKAWWTCSDCKSSYDATISDKARGTKCGYCNGKKVNHTNSLASLNPELASQWHPTKNGELTPHDVTVGSNKKVWWHCPKCESPYEMSVHSRSINRNCSFCRGLKTNHTNSLATLNPELASEWHPTKNGDLTPHDVTCGSDKKVWWKCSNHENHEWESTVSNRKAGKGCPICHGKNKIYVGFNDMWTTNPELASLLANPDDGYKYMKTSNIKVDWKCPDCGGIIRNKQINCVNREGLKCPKCSDGFSYPEKVAYHFLRQLEYSFEWEKSFEWSKGKRYDFYLPTHNIIIEVHGEQHYNGGFESVGGRTLQQEQENDKYKNQLAKKNGIEHYVVINAESSEFENIKFSIINSELYNIFEIVNIDWKKIRLDSVKSILIEVCRVYKNSSMSLRDVSEIFNISTCTTREYLKHGSKINICDYSPNNDREKEKIKTARSISVVQLDLDGNFIKRYNSISDVRIGFQDIYVNTSSISACCKGKLKTAGGYRWMYASEYDKYISENIRIPNYIKPIRKSTNVVRVNDFNEIKIYDSITEATISLGKKSKSSINSISACCKGKQKTALGFRWMYLDDYERKYGKLT